MGKWISQNVLRKLTVNAPVTLGFCILCLLVHIMTLGGYADFVTRLLAVHDDWNGLSIPQYTSFWTHCFAHSSFAHLRGNLTMLLLLGPGVEYHFRSKNVMLIMAFVSMVSALVHIIVGKRNIHQLGASGIVFCFILLNSLVSAKHGQIPVSFVLTVLLYMGDELIQFMASFMSFSNNDPVSHHAHIAGGLVGAAAGFYIHGNLPKRRRVRKVKETKKTKSSNNPVSNLLGIRKNKEN